MNPFSKHALIAETSGCRHLSIRFEPKRRAGAKLSPNSSAETIREFVTQRGVTAGLLAPGPKLFTARCARSAKLFTVGCGESCKGLSSPPMNNFGTPIRIKVRGASHCTLTVKVCAKASGGQQA